MIPLYNLRLAFDRIWLLQCSDLKSYVHVVILDILKIMDSNDFD